MMGCMDQNDIDLAAGDQCFRKTYDNEVALADGSTYCAYISAACMHCTDAPCIAACPVGCLSKDPETGFTVYDNTNCIGCKSCAMACPYGVPTFGDDGKMRKCDMCVDRLARKELPVCVAACPQRALDFGTVEELRKRHGDDGMIAPLAAGDYTKPNLLITKCAQAQPAPERTRSWPDFLNDKTA